MCFFCLILSSIALFSRVTPLRFCGEGGGGEYIYNWISAQKDIGIELWLLKATFNNISVIS